LSNTPVPEPSELALTALGALLPGFRRLRRRQNSEGYATSRVAKLKPQLKDQNEFNLE